MIQIFKITSNVSDDLEFERQENGDILLTVHDAFGKNCSYFQIDGGIWGSMVLSMTKFGERPNDWQEFMDHHNGREDILEFAKQERLKKVLDRPFASDVAETAYQALKKTGVDCTRDQFRPALRAFVVAEEASKRAYEEFIKKREQGLI